MDERGREDVHHFSQHGFQKPISGLIARAKVPGAGVQASVRKLAKYLGIGVAYFHGMAGHLDFRNNGDITFGGIGHQFLHLGLGVVSAGGAGRIGPGKSIAAGFPFMISIAHAPGGKGGEVRIGFAFQPPAGAVVQMQMQHIELQQGHGVYLFFQEFDTVETSGFVQHEPPVPQARVIQEGAAGERPQGPELFQAGTGAEKAFQRQCFYQNTFPADGKPIGLLLLVFFQGYCCLAECPPVQLYRDGLFFTDTVFRSEGDRCRHQSQGSCQDDNQLHLEKNPRVVTTGLLASALVSLR